MSHPSNEITEPPQGGKRVAIVQSSYIPWRGYFDTICSADTFILLDDVQYTKRDWRSRNRIKTAQGLQWLTIPVKSKGRRTQLIQETEVAANWADEHWTRIRHAYRSAPYFPDYASEIEGLYTSAAGISSLSEINRLFLSTICALLEIDTSLTWSREYPSKGVKTEKLLELCQAAQATVYISGPSAKAYLDESRFAAVGMTVEWMDYSGYPAYPQLHGAFEEQVSVLDLLFNMGPRARSCMKY